MSVDVVRYYFKQFGMQDRVLEFPISSATVEEAAEALKSECKRIAKTMSFMVDKKPILIVMPGDAKVDNPKYKSKFNKKAVMVKGDEVEKLIGHPSGGICPFVVNRGIKIYLDESLKRFDTVFPACGSRNSAIELTIEELEKCSDYVEWVNVGKGWE